MSSASLYRKSDASSAFFSIPELIENLCSSLDNSHILMLMQTSKTLCDAAAPCLWRNVDLDADYRVEQLYTLIDKRDDNPKNRVQTFAQLTYRTQSLKAGFAFMAYYLEGVFKLLDSDTVNAPLPHPSWIPEPQAKPFSKPIPLITRLNRLDVSLHRGPRRRTPFFEGLSQAPPLIPRLSRFMTCNVDTLTDVRLRDIPFPTVIDIRHLCRTISGLTHLANLAIDIPQVNKVLRQKLACSIVPMIFFCCPPSLVSFELKTTVREDNEQENAVSFREPSKEDSDYTEGSISPQQGQLSKLKVLKLPQHETGYRTNLLGPILARCSALEEWDVPFLHEAENVAELVNILQQNMNPETREKHSDTQEKRSWTLRHLQSTYPGTDGRGETVAAIMEIIPENQLKSLTFHGYEDTLPDVPGAFGRFISCLLGHSTSLVSIKLKDMDRIQSKTIKEILTTCTALETLALVCPETMLSRLLLDDATIQDWKCVNLKELRMVVDLRLGYGKEHEMLEKFYKQLGALKNLEILDLMSACRRPNNTSAHYSDTTMTGMLSLGGADGRQGYLNSLADLKSLRVLLGSFFLRNQAMKDLVGKDEVDWILKEWPCLEMIEFFSSREVMYVSHTHINTMKRQRPNLILYRKEK
ncbi:hypothetical protein BGW39_001049 [Mortierella sp. 14UC]|nr:hypothetical protein BGW39_001049 [Mortierella sp. 14UC]